MKLLFVGDFNVTVGTGYATILANVCGQLAERGHAVTVLAEKWDRSEHHFPFQVIPTDYAWIPGQALRLQQSLKFDHVILAMDVPKIEQILGEMKRQEVALNIPVSGLFPIESTPIASVWIKGLEKLHQRFVISEFGQRALISVGLDGVFVPMTSAIPEGEINPLQARKMLAGQVGRVGRVVLGNPDLLKEAGPLVLTVADNQDRKDLPVIGAALAKLDVRMIWMLVTRVYSGYGWYLPDLLKNLGVADQTVCLDGLTSQELSLAYRAADFFVIASQAEGACLPLYEAMAHGLPCIAPEHTAIVEALEGGRGELVPWTYQTIHPWGNVYRYHTTPEDLAAALLRIEPPENGALVDFIKSRPWSRAAEIVEGALDE